VDVSAPILGYFFMPSGINNQKLALLGLALEALMSGPRRISVPALCNYDLRDDSRQPTPFGHAFDAQQLGAFAARHGIDIDWSAAVPGLGDPFFVAASRIVGADVAAGRFGPDHAACDFLRSLVPHARGAWTLRSLSRDVFQKRGIRIVAQLRIETDWITYSSNDLTPSIGTSEDYAPGFRQIIDKIRNSLPDWEAGIYVVCDEGALPQPKEKIRAAARSELGVELCWKSDFLPPDQWAEMLAIDASLLDFEMASQAPSFVGLTRSTFSNLVTLERFARTRAHVTSHYIYNLPGPTLARRRDNGTHAVADAAINPVAFAGLEPAP